VVVTSFIANMNIYSETEGTRLAY